MIYIQSDDERSIPHHFDAACAMYGAISRGLDYRLTSYEEIVFGKFDKLIPTRLFIGSVEFLSEVFKRAGKKDPKVPINSDRESRTMSLKEFRILVEGGETLFVKPKQIKLFTGCVIDKMFLSSLSSYSEETEVLVYDPFKYPILSEWRLYIHWGKIVDGKNYSGDFTVSPDWKVCQEKISAFKDFPVSYTCDVAILSTPDGKQITEIVELNDMWAIGNYGIPNDLYLRLLRERYFEIMR